MRILLLVLLLSWAGFSYGQTSIDGNYKIYADTVGLTFSEFKELEDKGSLKFQQSNEFSNDINIYWIKIEKKALEDAGYLYLSQYFDRIEAYYPDDENPFTLSGRLVEFSERGYKKGFYLNVVDLKSKNEDLYLKLITSTGFSTGVRTLSNMEAVSSQEFEQYSSLINKIVISLSGMVFMILLINLILFYLRPNITLASYILLVVISILLVNVIHQSFVGVLDIKAWQLHKAEIMLNILVVGTYAIFTALYLKAYKHSKLLFYCLIFPFFIIQLAFIDVENSWFIKVSSGLYFILYLFATILLIIKVWNKEKRNCIIYLIANGPPMLAAILITLAVNDFLPSNYLTTSVVYMSLLLRDTIFTLAWVNHYFFLQKETLKSKVQIQQLKEEKKQLKRIEKLKTQFYNNISHELKTPLSLIISPLENSLKNKKLMPAVKKDLNFSLKNSKKMVQLVNEMLDLSKLDNAELTAICQPTDINSVVKNILLDFQEEAQHKNQKIIVHTTKEEIKTLIDQDKFEKIMSILISNAIKFSNKPGNIYIRIEDHKNDLKVRVRDEGIGITQKDLPQIFDRYFQSKNSSEVGGTGIGLFIAKKFMELHKGDIKCFSEPGKGATFKLHFPNAIVNQFNNDFSFTISKIDQSKQTILLVEDDGFMRSYLNDKLPEYNSIEASDGQEALNKLEEGPLPDLILTDYMMPNVDGYELTLQVKSNPKWMNIPIIFLTATSLNTDKIKILNLGIDDYIVKPFNLEELKIRIQKTLTVSEKRQKAFTQNPYDFDKENLHSFKIELDNFILEHLKSAELSNNELTQKFNLSERNLYRKVRTATGQSPASYIREIRLQKSRELLENHEYMQVSEIAQACGWNNLAHFSQTFKKRFGKTPKDYTSISN